jgi:hypothetical protein
MFWNSSNRAHMCLKSINGVRVLGCFLLVFLISAIYCDNAGSATYYVAPSGSDDAAGTFDNPWLTPQKAASTAVAGDVIYLRGGTYRVTGKISSMVNFSNYGEPGSTITMSGYVPETGPAETAILNGMLDRSKPSYWASYRGSIYYTDNLAGSEFDGAVPIVVQDDVALMPQSSLSRIKSPGQTYYDTKKKRLYVWAVGGGNPGNYHLEVSQCDQIFYFDKEDQYIVVENLTITGAYYGMRCVPEGCCRTFRNLTLKHFKEDAIKFNTVGNRDDTIERCMFSSYGDAGIDTFGSSNQKFLYNEFTKAHPWNVGGGIKSLADGNHHTIDGNYFHDINTSGWEGVIELREAEHMKVTNNLIVNTAGGINVYGDNETISTPVPDPTSVDVEIVNNTIYHTKSSAIWISKISSDILVKNNIVVQGSANSYCLRVDAGGETRFISNYNDFIRDSVAPVRWLSNDYSLLAYQTATGQDLNSITQDPCFVNPSGNDFHLAAGSPAINIGDAVSSLLDYDIEGRSRPQEEFFDLGAYEYVPEP